LRRGSEETADVRISSNFIKCKAKHLKLINSNFSCDFALDLVSKLEETSFKVPLLLLRGFGVSPWELTLLCPEKQKKKKRVNSKCVSVEKDLNVALYCFGFVNTIQILTKTSTPWVQ